MSRHTLPELPSDNLSTAIEEFFLKQNTPAGACRTSKEIEVNCHLCRHRWVSIAGDLMGRKNVQRIVPAYTITLHETLKERAARNFLSDRYEVN